jgi:dihydrofolate reductase
MRKLILKMSVSLDGFVCGPNGEADWIFKTGDEASRAWVLDTISQAGLHIMGSRTFNDMAAWWPFSTEIFAAPMNDIPKVVFSRKGLNPGELTTTTAFKNSSKMRAERGLKEAPDAAEKLKSWTNAQVATGDLTEEINRLKQQPGKDLLAQGGAGFAQSLIQAGVIDEYRLVTHPVALGKGLPIFSELAKPLYLKLVSSTAFESGVIAHVYRPA